MPIYAQAGVRELWLVDLEDRTLTRHDNTQATWQLGGTLSAYSHRLSSRVLEGLEIAFADVFPTMPA
jgi:Uma2 family endonuclease